MTFTRTIGAGVDPARPPKRLSYVGRTPKPSRRSRLRIGVHVGQLLQRVPGGIGRVTEMLCDELPKHAEVLAFSSCPRGSRRAIDALDDAVEFRSLGPGSPQWRYEVWNRCRRPRRRWS